MNLRLYSIDYSLPTIVLACSEPSIWFTVIAPRYGLQVVTVTVEDDYCSKYGSEIVRRCVNKKDDLLFFAGPCTGGSSWARLNRTRSEDTAKLVESRQELFWKLFEGFASDLERAEKLGACALFELPRGCDYWKDERVSNVITFGVAHNFDGCRYGLKQKHAKGKRLPIKKPWRIFSWNLDFGNSLDKRCNGDHEHAPCAGNETRDAQLYTSMIVGVIIRRFLARINGKTPNACPALRCAWKGTHRPRFLRCLRTTPGKAQLPEVRPGKARCARHPTPEPKSSGELTTCCLAVDPSVGSSPLGVMAAGNANINLVPATIAKKTYLIVANEINGMIQRGITLHEKIPYTQWQTAVEIGRKWVALGLPPLIIYTACMSHAGSTTIGPSDKAHMFARLLQLLQPHMSDADLNSRYNDWIKAVAKYAKTFHIVMSDVTQGNTQLLVGDSTDQNVILNTLFDKGVPSGYYGIWELLEDLHTLAQGITATDTVETVLNRKLEGVGGIGGARRWTMSTMPTSSIFLRFSSIKNYLDSIWTHVFNLGEWKGQVGLAMDNPNRYSFEDQWHNTALFREIYLSFQMSLKIVLFAMRRDVTCSDPCWLG